MQPIVIHLTDLHFTAKTEFQKKAASLVQAVASGVPLASPIVFLVLSGDIACSGKREEYARASAFISAVREHLVTELPGAGFHCVLVPGNHDCDFSLDSQLRRNTIAHMGYPTLGNDNSVVSQALCVQAPFWEFYRQYASEPADKLYYRVPYDIDGREIVFHCVNTAWMSSLKEEPGTIFFPVKQYLENHRSGNSIDIGVWHHPYNWFTPNTSENNKTEFQEFTERFASLHLFG